MSKKGRVNKVSGVFEIQKGIAVPPKRRPDKAVYPWHSLGVGDSFFIPNRRVCGGLHQLSRAAGIEIKVRSEGGGLRVWRTA